MIPFPDIGIKPYHQDEQLTLFHGDCREVLAALPAESVHCAVTSPPYWGLRDYGIGSDALGLESTPELYVEHLVEIFREVRRVLRKDGTVWLNLGDSYATGGQRKSGRTDADRRAEWGQFGDGQWKAEHAGGERTMLASRDGLKPKDLIGIPWRVAFALQADDWYIRSDIIWHKPNPMPESVTDRPTSAHEYLFLLTRSSRYYYDADAIREPAQDRPFDPSAKSIYPNDTDWHDNRYAPGASGYGNNPLGRNKRTVWTIATQPYPDAHFATYPQKLVEPCVLAGTSAWGVCPKCGAPWERIVEVSGGAIGESWHDHENDETLGNRASNNAKGGHGYKRESKGWRKTCRHITDPVPATVLDPFSGSGTTLLVANNLGRRATGIEANAEYCQMSVKRFGQGTMLS